MTTDLSPNGKTTQTEGGMGIQRLQVMGHADRCPSTAGECPKQSSTPLAHAMIPLATCAVWVTGELTLLPTTGCLFRAASYPDAVS